VSAETREHLALDPSAECQDQKGVACAHWPPEFIDQAENPAHSALTFSLKRPPPCFRFPGNSRSSKWRSAPRMPTESEIESVFFTAFSVFVNSVRPRRLKERDMNGQGRRGEYRLRTFPWTVEFSLGQFGVRIALADAHLASPTHFRFCDYPSSSQPQSCGAIAAPELNASRFVPQFHKPQQEAGTRNDCRIGLGGSRPFFRRGSKPRTCTGVQLFEPNDSKHPAAPEPCPRGGGLPMPAEGPERCRKTTRFAHAGSFGVTGK